MALKKRGRKKQVEQTAKPGRKKELKRFELDTLGNADTEALDKNEVAFLVRTSGGTPLNQTDVAKLHRLLQHELRRLGHKLKRKGQDLDPAPKPAAEPETPAPAEETPSPEEGAATVEEITSPHEEPMPAPNPSLADPDNSDPTN